MDMSRFKNVGLWVSLASLVPIVCQTLGVHLFGEYATVVNLVLSILVGAGVLSNPKEGAGYLDVKPVEQAPTEAVEENKSI